MIGRRGVLTLGAVVLGGLTGCTDDDVRPATPVTPGPDEMAVRRAAATARQLAAAATTLAGSRPAQARVLRRIAAVHQAHLTALGGVTPSPSPSPSPSTTSVSTLNQLLAAEWAGARAALHDGDTATDPAYALLLVRVAAARAADADLLAVAIEKKPYGPLRPSPAVGATGALTPTPSPTPTSPGPDVTGARKGVPQLDRLLAGQHAAVFAYPVVIARSTGARRALAKDLWAEHRRERDELETAVLSTGGSPTPAEPAYDVGPPPTSGAKAAALAVRVERGLTALAADVVAAATGGTRVLGADQLVLAARRTAAWTGRPAALVT